jgi:branched-chain amino acid transport system substrate-binding protein
LVAAFIGTLCAMGMAVAGEDVIVLGAAVSLTGKYAQNGANTKNGYEFAVRKINDRGGIVIGGTSYKLVVHYYDDESTPARGTELAERLIQQDGVRYILGPYSSGLTKAILPVVEKHKVPMVEANGAARELFTKGYRYIFAVLSTSVQYLTPAIDLAAEHAEKLGKTPETLTVALAIENDPFAQDVRAGVLADIERHGMRCVIDDQLPPELNDMSVTLTKVKALKPDVLVISGHEKGALTAISQIKALKVYVPILAMARSCLPTPTWADCSWGISDRLRQLQRVARVDRGLARPRRLLEQSARLSGLGGIGEGPGDQPPLLVGRKHAPWL